MLNKFTYVEHSQSHVTYSQSLNVLPFMIACLVASIKNYTTWLLDRVLKPAGKLLLEVTFVLSESIHFFFFNSKFCGFKEDYLH